MRVSAGGGEYPLQDGFGWTNGVLRVLLALYPGAVNVQDTKPSALTAGATGASRCSANLRRH